MRNVIKRGLIPSIMVVCFGAGVMLYTRDDIRSKNVVSHQIVHEKHGTSH